MANHPPIHSRQEGRTMDPPRSGWEVPYESRGSVTQAVSGVAAVAAVVVGQPLHTVCI